VGQLEAEMSSVELSEWLAFDRIEPLPDPWRQTGLACAVTANLWTKGKRHQPEDFIPARKESVRQPPGKIAAKMAAFAAAHNERI
jgi:hypothetical protein